MSADDGFFQHFPVKRHAATPKECSGASSRDAGRRLKIVHLKGCTQTMCWHTNSCNIAAGALSSPICNMNILDNANCQVLFLCTIVLYLWTLSNKDLAAMNKHKYQYLFWCTALAVAPLLMPIPKLFLVYLHQWRWLA